MIEKGKTLVIDRSPIRASSSPAGTIADAIDPVIYFESQHETWRRLCERQLRAWQGRVLEDLHDTQHVLFHDAHEIPTLAALSRRLGNRYGWRLVRADGLLPFPIFVHYLSQKLFPCSDFIRDLSEVEYTNEPDMFHDLMGHLPTLAHPFFAGLNQALGRAGTLLETPEALADLEKVYWFCLEFGLVNPTAYDGVQRDPKRMRAYGAGLLAAPGELAETFSGLVEIRPFSVKEVLQTPIDVYQKNTVLFEVDRLENLSMQLTAWFMQLGLYP